MLHEIFPFHQISNFELQQLLEAPNKRITKLLRDNGFENQIRHALANSMINIPNCQYYHENTLEQVLQKHKSALTILNLNIRSLDKHLSDLLVLLQSVNHNFDIICLSEIGVKNVENRLNIIKSKYNFEFVKPERKRCGGVCILIRRDLRYAVRNDLKMSDNDAEDLWVETTIDNQNVIVGSVYRHPGTNMNSFQTRMESTLLKINMEKSQAFVCGDFNIDGLKAAANRPTSDFYNCLMTNNFLPCITLPTRITDSTMTLIDNILSNTNARSTFEVMLSGNIYSDISDHLPNFIIVSTGKSTSPKPERRKVRLYGEKNFHRFNCKMIDTDWSKYFDSSNVDEILKIFYHNYSEAFSESFPLKQLSRQRAKDKPWLTTGLRKSIRHKAKLYSKYLNHPTTEIKEKYLTYKNSLTTILRKAEANYYLEKIDQKKKNIRALWQIYGPIIHPNKTKK